MQRLRVIDLLCGAGGWAVAARGLPIEFRFALDWDAGCLQTYRENHPWPIVQADVLQDAVDWQALAGKVDVVLGAIPCETISAARRLNPPEAGEITSLHAVLDGCLAIVRALRPLWWVLEDVSAVVKHLPPLTPHVILDSAQYSPQHRKRAFIGTFPQPAGGHDRRKLADCLRPGPYRLTLRANGRRPVTNGWAAGTYQPWLADRKARTVVCADSRKDLENMVQDGDCLRQLTWEECALLQGFPSNYLFRGSPQQVASQIRQAIQIDCGRAILQAIVNSANGR